LEAEFVAQCLKMETRKSTAAGVALMQRLLRSL
jgi:hypothetical protein